MPVNSSEPPTLLTNWLEFEGSHAPLLRFGNLLEWLIELAKTTSMYWFILKDIKEQPDEKVCGVRSRRIPSTGAYVPVDLGCATLPTRPSMFTNQEVLQISLLEFLSPNIQLSHPSWRLEVGLKGPVLCSLVFW